jgi:hypothetical protein
MPFVQRLDVFLLQHCNIFCLTPDTSYLLICQLGFPCSVEQPRTSGYFIAMADENKTVEGAAADDAAGPAAGESDGAAVAKEGGRERERWPSRVAFYFAGIGAAVG